MTRSAVEGLRGAGRYSDYLGERYPDFRKSKERWRMGDLGYDGFTVQLDFDEVVGGVWGNGLERYGTPILAVGDTGEDVERLLGRPCSAGQSHYGRGEAEWIFYYELFTLVVSFDLSGRVSGFFMRANDFHYSVY